MPSTRADLLLQPVRLRIVLEASGSDVTAADLAARLPDVPQATLYRQIGVLLDAGLLEVVTERRVRGGVERTLRLVAGAGTLGAADVADMTPDEHRRGFLSFVGALIGSFDRYIERRDASPGSDPMGYRQTAMWLTDEEAARMEADLNRALAPYLAHEATPGRRRALLSTVLVPDAPTDSEASDEPD